MAQVEARLAEAGALLQLNHQRRLLAEVTLIGLAVISLSVAVVALATETAEVLLPLPPVALLLQAISFELYAEVTVIGAARQALERLVNADLGQSALLYEERIAPIRKQPPLNRGVRGLQIVARLATLAAVIIAAVIVADCSWWAIAGFALSTLGAGWVCALAYRDMTKAPSIAATSFSLGPTPRP